jgi:hypothetical protein
MPLMKYFGFVGSALVILLFGLSWCFPQPVSVPVRSGIDRSSSGSIPSRSYLSECISILVCLGPPPSDFVSTTFTSGCRSAMTAGPKPKNSDRSRSYVKSEVLKKVVAHRRRKL